MNQASDFKIIEDHFIIYKDVIYFDIEWKFDDPSSKRNWFGMLELDHGNPLIYGAKFFKFKEDTTEQLYKWSDFSAALQIKDENAINRIRTCTDVEKLVDPVSLIDNQTTPLLP
ncbi:MAG: hypothetical protein ACFFCS_26475 [Candidatus Hodarchaeota archaeon]